RTTNLGTVGSGGAAGDRSRNAGHGRSLCRRAADGIACAAGYQSLGRIKCRLRRLCRRWRGAADSAIQVFDADNHGQCRPGGAVHRPDTQHGRDRWCDEPGNLSLNQVNFHMDQLLKPPRRFMASLQTDQHAAQAPWPALVLIMAVAFVVRLAWMLLFTGAIDTEGAEYARIAQNLLAG